jgi:membrane protein DedA with SNARE-associated domain
MTIVGELLALSSGTLLSEDLACISAGVLVASGELTFTAATTACFLGIAAGDIGLYCAGRILGRRLEPWLGGDRMQRAAEWLSGNTAKAVLISRFVPGTRTYTYIAAGVLSAPTRRFVSALVFASAVWTPLLVGGTAALGKELIHSVISFQTGALLLGVIVLLRAMPKLFLWEVRRRILGWFLRKVRWEFWPRWAAYLPMIPAFAFLAIRHRSATVFTAANPAIYTGGLLDESKSSILQSIGEQAAVASWEIVRPGMAVYLDRAFPVVCKPDVGERGRGVKIVRSPEQLAEYLSSAETPTIVQEYVSGKEFGIFYYRRPGQNHGRISSITSKVFPTVTGDGVRTLRQLVMADARAVAIADVYLRRRPDAGAVVPAKGEGMLLVEVGAHCGGTIFLDGTSLITPALEERVDRIGRSTEGFYYGRFDVRAPSVEALQRGEFRILELNGVAAEPTHIYDPAVSLVSAYKALWHHWSVAWAIGAENRRRGARLTTASELVGLALERGRNLIRRQIDALLTYCHSRRDVPIKP